MNVLFLTSSLPRFKNDSQIPFIYEQARAWKEERPQDEVLILAPHDERAKKEEVDDAGIKIFRFVYWWPVRFEKLAYPAIIPNLRNNPLLFFQVPAYFIAQFLSSARLIKNHRIDLIYAHWVMPQGVIAYWLNVFTRVPYVLQNHSSDLRLFRKIPLIGLCWARKIIRRCRMLFCVNNNLKGEALAFFKEAERPGLATKIGVLPMGAYLKDLTKIADAPTNGPFRYDFSLIGRLTKKKGGDLFIKALTELERRGIKFKAAIAGEGEEKPSLQQMTKSPSIDFVGFIMGAEKTKFFQQTKFFVFPSLEIKGDIEGLPVAIMEALNAGKMIIASDDTNIKLLPEWDQIKEAVFMIDDPTDVNAFADLLAKLLTAAPVLTAPALERLRKTIERYRWNNLIKEYLAALKLP